MNKELYLIKLLFSYDLYLKYHKVINSNYIRETNKELGQIVQAIENFHETYPDKNITNVDSLELHFYTCFPATSKRDRDVYTVLLDKLRKLDVDSGLVESYVKGVQERSRATRIAILALEVSEGRKDWQSLTTAFLEASEGIVEGVGDTDLFVDTRLSVISRHYEQPGLRWRLDSMNKMMGSLRKGNYGFIFARPETGKTTFLASEVTFMAEQLEKEDGPILWFNNEQPGQEVMEYLYRACLGLTTAQLHATIEENEKRYENRIGSRIRVFDNASIYRRDVERILNQYTPSLVIFDQIDKLKGFESDRDDLKLGQIYQWARELAKQYCPVIGVCQAGESGANKRYLTMEDVVNAKTSKQSEADWILGIGKLNIAGYEGMRHLHLSKNKLIGDKDTDPRMRHGKMDVKILADIARYEDFK